MIIVMAMVVASGMVMIRLLLRSWFLSSLSWVIAIAMVMMKVTATTTAMVVPYVYS